MTDKEAPAAVPGPDQPAPQEIHLGPGLPVLLIGGGTATGDYPHGVVMVRELHGGIHHHAPEPPPPPVPQQLPELPPPPGRDDARRALTELVRPGSAMGAALVVIAGPVPVASALASEALRVTETPGGHLYVNLAGPDGPVAPEEALAELLAAVGAAGAPAGLAEMSAHWRTATATRPVALLADDAVSAAQVRPLLPSGVSVTVVTSSYPLTGLVVDGARLLVLEPPGEDGQAGS